MAATTSSAAYHHNADLGPAVEITGAVLTALSVLVVVCRTYVRCLRKRTTGWDDACILLATAFNIASGVAQLKFTGSGLGKHMWQLSRPAISYTLKWFIIGTFESYVCLFFVRASIGIFVLRMLAPTQRGCRIAVHVGMILNFAITVVVLTVDSIWCQPLEGLWNKSIRAKCISPKIVGHANMASYAISAAIDILFASVPIGICWPMQMDRKLKRNLTIIMLLSLATCACAIGKAISVKDITPDFTFANVPVTFWAIFEVNIGIIVASLPAVRQFYTVTCADVSRLLGRRGASVDDSEDSMVPSTYGSAKSWPGTASRPTTRTSTMRTFYDDSKVPIAKEWPKSASRTTWRTIESESDIELDDRRGTMSPWHRRFEV